MRYIEKTDKQALKMAKLLTGGESTTLDLHQCQEKTPLTKSDLNKKMDPAKKLNQNVQYIYNITAGNNCTIIF